MNIYDWAALACAALAVAGFYLMHSMDIDLEHRQRLYWHSFAGPILIIAGGAGAIWFGILGGFVRIS